MKTKKIGLLCVISALLCSCGMVMASGNGINLPPTQGTSGEGAFLPGVYYFGYTNNDVAGIVNKDFTHIRIPINVETANDAASLDKIEGYFAQVDYRGIICMFDTLQAGETGHGNGRPNNLAAMANAWANIHEWFADYPNIKYEIFNEPYGYGSASTYMNDMQYIMTNAGLPSSKCIIDGIGSAATNVQAIKNLWSGSLAYHFYPSRLAAGSCTQSAFSNALQNDLAGVSNRTYITEFGSILTLGDYYETYTSDTTWWGQNINCLRGMHDAVAALRNAGNPIKASYLWHGWHNSDSYDVWYSGSNYGAEKVINIQKDTGGYYKIINKNSGKCAQVNGYSTANGGDITQWSYTGGTNCQWQLASVGGGYYQIINRNSGKCAQVNGASTADGADITQWTYNGADNCKWWIESTGAISSGYFKIINKNSGKCMMVINSGLANGDDIVQWTDDGADNAQWRIMSSE